MTEAEARAINLGSATPRPGELVEIITKCPETGRSIHTFKGSMSAWMNDFKGPAFLQVRIHNTGSEIWKKRG